MGEVLAPVIDEIVGWIISEGVKWVIGFIIGEDGEKEPVKFIDDDGDGVPDNPDEPFLPWDPSELLPDVEPEKETSYIIVNPDGTMTIFDNAGNITADNCDFAYSLWVSENGIMNKKLDNYSVTEGLLALLLLFTVINFVRGLFRRKDIYR